MSKGMKSSEFKLAVATVVSVIMLDVFGIRLQVETIASVITAVSSYIVSRGMAKSE